MTPIFVLSAAEKHIKDSLFLLINSPADVLCFCLWPRCLISSFYTAPLCKETHSSPMPCLEQAASYLHLPGNRPYDKTQAENYLPAFLSMLYLHCLAYLLHSRIDRQFPQMPQRKQSRDANENPRTDACDS